MLDAIYSHSVRFGYGSEEFVRLGSIADEPVPPLAVAQIMWLGLLLKTLKLDEMFAFGASKRYVRTGVGERATVYHDQIGQNQEAGISRSIGVIGLKEAGIHIVECAIAHEISTVYVLEHEYGDLPSDIKYRLEEMISIIKEISKTEDLSIEIMPVSRTELIDRSTYVLNAEVNSFSGLGKEKDDEQIHIDIL